MNTKCTALVLCGALAAIFVIGVLAANRTLPAAPAATDHQFSTNISGVGEEFYDNCFDDVNLGTDIATAHIRNEVNQFRLVKSQIDSKLKDVTEKISAAQKEQ